MQNNAKWLSFLVAAKMPEQSTQVAYDELKNMANQASYGRHTLTQHTANLFMIMAANLCKRNFIMKL